MPSRLPILAFLLALAAPFGATEASGQGQARRSSDLNAPVGGPPQRIVYDAAGRFARESPVEADPRWWGAVPGDGLDDTAALQAAVDAAVNEAIESGRPVRIAPGEWLVSEPVVIETDAAFSSRAGIVVEGSGQYTRIRQTDPTKAVVEWTGGAGRSTQQGTLRDIYLQGGTYGLYAPKQATMLIENVTVFDTSVAGIYLSDSWNSQIRHVYVVDNAGDGVVLDGNANGMSIDNLTVARNGGRGLYVQSGFGTSVTGSVFEQNGGGGLHVNSGRGWSLSGNYFEGNDAFQLALGGASTIVHNAHVAGNYFNGLSLGAGRLGVSLVADEGTEIVDNHFRNLVVAYEWGRYARGGLVAESNTYDAVTDYVGISGDYSYTFERLASDGVRLRIPGYSWTRRDAAVPVENLLPDHVGGWGRSVAGSGFARMRKFPSFEMQATGAGFTGISSSLTLSNRRESIKGKVVTLGFVVRAEGGSGGMTAFVGAANNTVTLAAGETRHVTVTTTVGAAATGLTWELRTAALNTTFVVEDAYLVVGTEPASGLHLPVRRTDAPGDGTWDAGVVVWNSAPTATRNISHWLSLGGGAFRAVGAGSGPTAGRPALTSRDEEYRYWDEDLGKEIRWNGAGWDL